MIKTLADVIDNIRQAGLPELWGYQSLRSTGYAKWAGKLPQSVEASPAILRPLLNGIRPARFRITNKTFANVRSLFIAALERAGMVDRLDRGSAKSDGQWGPLVGLLGSDKRLQCGLASFLNRCVQEGVRRRTHHAARSALLPLA